MTEGAVYDLVQAWLSRLDEEATALAPSRVALTRIIRDHQDAPRPAGAYATITMLGSEDLGEVRCETSRSVTIAAEDRVALTVARAVQWTFRIDVFAKEAMNAIRLFRTAAVSSQTHVDLAPLVIRSVGEATRAPDLTQQNWEGRARFDLSLAGLVADEMLIDVIDTGSVNFEGRGGADVLTTLEYQRA
jgi:hypothetical protein